MAPRSDSAARYSSSRSAPVRSARSRTWAADSSPVTYSTRVAALAATSSSSVDFPTPGSPASSTTAPGTSPPPSTRSSSDTPVGRARAVSSATSAMRRAGVVGAPAATRERDGVAACGLDERAPRLARRAAPHPLRRPVLAGRAAVGRAGAGGHSPLRALVLARVGHRHLEGDAARALEGQHDRVGRAHLQVRLSPVRTTCAGWCPARRRRCWARPHPQPRWPRPPDLPWRAPGGLPGWRLLPARSWPARWGRAWLRRPERAWPGRRRRARAWPALKPPDRRWPAPKPRGRSSAARPERPRPERPRVRLREAPRRAARARWRSWRRP